MVVSEEKCIVIGASHAGVNLAFALRKEGWQGEITLFDADPTLPYHRPPLSKAYLTSDDGIEKNLLKSADSYVKDNISLNLGVSITTIDRANKTITTGDGVQHSYTKLVIATGARPFIPPIKGINDASHLYPLRSAADVNNIRQALKQSHSKQVVIIGGGYIGLETAASMRKLGATVTVLEREERILARVTAPVMSEFFQQLHDENGVQVLTQKDVTSIVTTDGKNVVNCSDNSQYQADVIVVGVGIRVNSELAAAAGLTLENGIAVDGTARTSDKDIYAIGDCSFHHNPHYDRHIRLESVQNAVDQAKTAAASICGKDVNYDSLPWFWSDQYDIKLQMVGLSQGYNKILVRQELGEGHKFSVWYFKDDTILAVDAVNNAKAYVVGTKFIKGGDKIDQAKLVDPEVEFKPANLLA
ncbi:FAD-dependent oxidoreductase [Paraglaciecola aquimarina]|uniref:FAD-dependent oxidoreductase n=1 Tax=Paraglaciecola aquimarina TaxID=1235557 RepID=A0ABU3SZE4_9ALTE|nr:FAD-dependent oxidoreductase [Paraglaciecola aquimarina]MDU0355394.1 FAD-dependent oxidoreductase [Paraglaciecola aquimarina]